ncbi:hypothetical protein ACUTJJ_05195 [Agrobacterium sp. DKPNP3]|uniref:hypothetical protein n=1 Tax=Agrobacterium sp. DKPNP3 TaxID=3457323 RepID=UPI0040449061
MNNKTENEDLKRALIDAQNAIEKALNHFRATAESRTQAVLKSEIKNAVNEVLDERKKKEQDDAWARLQMLHGNKISDQQISADRITTTHLGGNLR